MAEYLEVANEFHVWLGERGEDGSIVPGSADTIITVCDLDARDASPPAPWFEWQGTVG